MAQAGQQTLTSHTERFVRDAFPHGAIGHEKTLLCRGVVVFLTTDGAKRARTADLLGAIQALSQLSYGPVRRSL